MSHGTASLLGGRPVFQGGLVPNAVGIGTNAISNMQLVVTGTPTPSSNTAYGIFGGTTAADGTTTAFYQFYSNPRTEAAAFTVATLTHFRVADPTIGSTSAITTQEGFTVSSGMVGATNNYGFRGLLGAASGRYNLYMDGTAQNYLAGVTGIGIAASSTSALTLPAGTTGVASLRITHGAAPSSPVDGDVWSTTAGLFIRINGVTKTVTLT